MPFGIFERFQKFSVADPDPRSGAFLTPGSRMNKKSGSGSGMNNLDHISESLETIFFGVKDLNPEGPTILKEPADPTHWLKESKMASKKVTS
jgi:hypothetical protein